MFHDIILALNGVGGQILKNLIDDDDTVFLTHFIHPCEKRMLEDILNTADYYKRLKEFIKNVPQFGNDPILFDDGGGELAPGMYLRALCSGMADGLGPYTDCVVGLEQELLQDPHLLMSYVVARLRPFTPLLLTLNSIVNQIINRRLHGCEILQLLHQHIFSGQPQIDAVVQCMMQRCHRVLLKQMMSWLLHGQLIDPFGEFFIEEIPAEERPHDPHSSMATLDSDMLTDNASDAPTVEYRVAVQRVPCYVPASVPDKVRFIGTTVVLFTRDPWHANPGRTDRSKHDSLLKRMENALLERAGTMQESPTGLDVGALEAVVDEIRSLVTQHLLSLAKDEADLCGELRLIRDHLLLGRGELFLTFLRKARAVLLGPVGRTSARDLSNHIYAAARTVHYNSDDIMEKFSFKVPPKDHVSPKTNVWSTMSLEYKPPWPLHLLITPAVVASYNVLFNFLLQVKIAELNLHEVLITNVKIKGQGKLPADVWRLCNLFTFVVHSVHCWLQMDIVEAEFNAMLSELGGTTDFEQVIHKHSVFLVNISTQAYLLLKEVQTNPDQPTTVKTHPVNLCLVSILKLCDSFCSEASGPRPLVEARLAAISEQLNNHLAVLCELMGLLGEKVASLRQLLMRLDYNYYCTKNIAEKTSDS